MMERGKNFLRRFKRPKYWITALILALIVIGIVHRAVSSKAPAFDTATVTRQTVAQEVDATGNVKSAEAVDLAFETGGKVANLAVKVGDRVKAGDRLANLSNADAAANLASAQAKLDQLLQGARPEDLAVSQSSVDKANSDLENAELDVQNKMSDAFVKADDAVSNHADKLYENAKTSPSFGATVSSGGTTYRISAPDTNTAVKLSQERRDAEDILEGWSSLSASGDTDAAATKAEDGLSKIQTMLSDIADAINSLHTDDSATQEIYTSFKTEVSTARTDVSAALASLRSSLAAYDDAKSALAIAQKQQDLKAAPATSEDIKIQQAAVDVARAAYNKTVITAPFDGLITKVEPTAGEIVGANTPVISLIADDKLEVEVDIPEADIPKVHLGAEADVTFDAYGKDFVATSTVAEIDPAATVVEGVPTYRTVLLFSTIDPRIKSGMTANLTIHGDSRENVLAVPQRAVIIRDGQNIVEKVIDGKTVDTPVETGLRGSEGTIEILSGLNEGDQVVASPSATGN